MFLSGPEREKTAGGEGERQRCCHQREGKDDTAHHLREFTADDVTLYFRRLSMFRRVFAIQTMATRWRHQHLLWTCVQETEENGEPEVDEEDEEEVDEEDEEDDDGEGL